MDPIKSGKQPSLASIICLYFPGFLTVHVIRTICVYFKLVNMNFSGHVDDCVTGSHKKLSIQHWTEVPVLNYFFCVRQNFSYCDWCPSVLKMQGFSHLDRIDGFYLSIYVILTFWGRFLFQPLYMDCKKTLCIAVYQFLLLDIQSPVIILYCCIFCILHVPFYIYGWLRWR